MPSDKTINLLLGPGLRCGCVRCGDCCRWRLVSLDQPEVERLQRLQWPSPLGMNAVCRIGGHPYLAHRANGDCIYLDPQKSLCRLELQHGHSAKPVGCRVYPLNLVTVLPDTVSCGVRFDCPAIQQGAGKLLAEQRPRITGFVAEMGFDGQVDGESLAGLSPETVTRLAEFLSEVATGEDATPATGGVAMLLVVRRLRGLGATFLNDWTTLREVLPSLRNRMRAEAAALLACPRRPGAFNRGLFRLCFAGYLRRDQYFVAQPFRARLRRTWHLLRIFFGGGRFSALAPEHPDAPPPALGRGVRIEAEPAAWTVWRRWLDGRLRTLQFFGRAWYHGSFFDGADALAATAPLIVAAAVAHAAGRGQGGTIIVVTAADVEYAVGAIDHGFGRSALHMQWHHRPVEERFQTPAVSASFLAALGMLR